MIRASREKIIQVLIDIYYRFYIFKFNISEDINNTNAKEIILNILKNGKFLIPGLIIMNNYYALSFFDFFPQANLSNYLWLLNYVLIKSLFFYFINLISLFYLFKLFFESNIKKIVMYLIGIALISDALIVVYDSDFIIFITDYHSYVVLCVMLYLLLKDDCNGYHILNIPFIPLILAWYIFFTILPSNYMQLSLYKNLKKIDIISDNIKLKNYKSNHYNCDKNYQIIKLQISNEYALHCRSNYDKNIYLTYKCYDQGCIADSSTIQSKIFNISKYSNKNYGLESLHWLANILTTIILVLPFIRLLLSLFAPDKDKIKNRKWNTPKSWQY